ncbi:MAG: NAD-binding protein [Limimaricola sp.]|uniref:NAD(P)-dependent oxidoreductase n=1 Tax=Limimaricola sp. TaxID=2211665 RepID=UPI001D9AEF49|nr:NAD(P)-binding domain-containing protein [Limimaricola sp.]MBI1415872.1 NAD-binding protein [Limimaricola sp.]
MQNAIIGVAGCGRMGLGMLRCLRRANFSARGLDIRSGIGPEVTTDAGTFATGLTTLVTVVRDAEQTDAVLFGAQGIVARAPGLRHILVCSTLSPRYVLQLQDRVPTAITLIDAPMSGAQSGADAGTLSFMLGGDAAGLDAVQPLIDAMGRVSHRMGPYGAGMRAKVLNNMIAAASVTTTRLALDWAMEGGLDPRAFLDLVNDSSGQTWFSSGFDRIEFARDGLADDNSIGILAKDVAAALDAAPPGADTSLPEKLRAAILSLGPLDGV